ncbi:MAG TPA: FecR family protein [Accumulibacter sp.]|nr:FecR family protein [Accumulibacter sp.]
MMYELLRPTLLLRLLLTIGMLLTLASAARATPAVGEVTLCIGTSQIQREGRSESVTKGYSIVPGDVIRTTTNGHVHVRFVDGALVSVRPDSVLQVVEYRYDPANPSASLIKFYLETGTMRGISGLAAQAARDKFRLNTPLVAIGVKGTDFVTQADAKRAVVLVNQGAIVLAPLDNTCLVDGFGPCATPRSRELAATMDGMALVYRQAAREPLLQPVNSLQGGDKIAPTLFQERISSASTATVVADGKDHGRALSEEAAAAMESLRLARQAAESRVIPPTNSLTWGRWGDNVRPGDNLTVPFKEALSGNRVTVGDGYYFLFRNETITNTLTNASGLANFRLESGTASYRDPFNVVSAAIVDGGSLSIDFGRNTFATQLAVTAQSVGTQAVAATGTIDRTTGVFLSNGAADRVSGAVSLDTSQAGYFFSKSVRNGALMGATLWRR